MTNWTVLLYAVGTVVFILLSLFFFWIEAKNFLFAAEGKFQKAFATNVFCSISPALLLSLSANLYFEWKSVFIKEFYYLFLVGIIVLSVFIIARAKKCRKNRKKVSFLFAIIYYLSHISVAAIFGCVEAFIGYLLYYGILNSLLYVTGAVRVLYFVAVISFSIFLFWGAGFIFSPDGIGTMDKQEFQTPVPKRARKYRN